MDDKEDWRREEEVETDHRKIEEMVLQKFLRTPFTPEQTVSHQYFTSLPIDLWVVILKLGVLQYQVLFP